MHACLSLSSLSFFLITAFFTFLRISCLPKVYVPDIYSTDSAGNFIGKPLIDRLHDYPHYGEDDFERNAGYQKSIMGFFASIVIVGLFCMCWMWGINLCACCKCCRDCLPCCFNIFAHKVQRGKCTVIFFFFIAALLATCSCKFNGRVAKERCPKVTHFDVFFFLRYC